MTTRFSASYAPRLMACPASGNLDVAIPGWQEPVVDHDAGAKGKGTQLHKYLEKTSELSASDLHALSQALAYMAEVRSRRRFKVLTEASTTADWLASKPQTTVDVVLYVQNELHIIDYKTGRIPVDVTGNEQLLYYAVCWAHLAPQAKGVWLHIVQPWADNMAAIFVTTDELKEFMQRAQEAELKVLNKDCTFGPSDHCKFCPANPQSRGDKGRPFCPVMMKLLYPPKVDEAEILEL